MPGCTRRPPVIGAIERRYLSLGGELYCKSRVDKILVKDDKAVGMRLADGTEHHGDIIISAADGHTTIFDMLDGRYTDEKIRGYYDNPKLFPPLVYIGLGVARSFDNVSSVAGMTFWTSRLLLPGRSISGWACRFTTLTLPWPQRARQC